MTYPFAGRPRIILFGILGLLLMLGSRLLSNFLNLTLPRVEPNIVRKMFDWSVEKNIIENMSIEEKRKLYNTYVTLEQIDTWQKQSQGLPPPEERDVKIFGDTKIKSELNEKLAKKISIWKGDITKLEIDAVVNAANSKLRGGGGVDGAIHRAAGKYLLAECISIKGGCPTGEARITGGYNMPAKHIIHTVGPMDKSHPALINCYKRSFTLMKTNNLKSVAFPCIGTGVYNFPNVEASHIALSEAREFLEDDELNNGGNVERIIFCVFEPKDEKIYKSAAQLYFPTN